MATMNNQFFEEPILNTPYGFPARHWELDEQGQPTQRIIESRRRAEFITPIPKPKKRKGAAEQKSLLFDEGKGLSTQEQRYAHTAMINSVRQQVDEWRALLNANDWRVTPETARLLQHWRHHEFSSIRPFFCQIEAVETAIWLTEVAPQAGKAGEGVLDHLVNANNDANPELNFRGMAADEIERGGKLAAELKMGKALDDVTLLREVMNTVGKHGQLGGMTRCVVSESMLTEGWDANTVTHVLGVRAFGTRLLCEQVIGRALRRQSYDLNEDGLFNVEYADVPGIPFDFTAKPVVAPPQPPRETIQVKAVRPERGCAGNPISARRGLPRRTARGTPERRVQRRLRAGADPGPGGSLHHQERRHHRRVGRSQSGALGRHASLDAAVSPHASTALHQVARPRRSAEAASVRPVEAHHPAMTRRLPRAQG